MYSIYYIITYIIKYSILFRPNAYIFYLILPSNFIITFLYRFILYC